MKFPLFTNKRHFLCISSQAFLYVLLGILFCFSPSANAQQLQAGNINIKPSEPTKNWEATRELFPGESTELQVSVTIMEDGYELDPGSTTIHINNGQSLWTTTQGQNGDTNFKFEILNSGETPNSHSVEVKAIWSKKAGGGSGGGSGVDKKDGSATGSAYNDIPVFTWYYESRLEYADGETPINFTATAAVGGATLDLQD